MFSWRLLPLALLAGALGACAPGLGSGRPNAFRVVETRHFALYTDLSRGRAEEQARRLEQLLFALQHTGWESTADLPLRMNVIMFEELRDFQTFAGDDVGGFAIAEALYEPWMVLPAPRFGEDYATVAHELTHLMAYQAIRRLPGWLSEGLASYFESAHFHVDGSFQLGAVPTQRHGWLQLGWDLPSQLTSGGLEEDDLRFYSSSWLLVHFLMTRHADAFVAFQGDLARGVEAGEAFRNAFPALQGDALDQALQDYARVGSFESVIFDLELPQELWLRTRSLSLADEHALRALLWTHAPNPSDQRLQRAAIDLQRALRLDPGNVWANTLSVRLSSRPTKADLERAYTLARAHPEHWMSWVTLGLAAAANGQLEQLSRDPRWDPGAHAMDLEPTQPYALAMQGVTAAMRGERALALARIEAAQRLQPTHPAMMAMHVVVLSTLAACSELRAYSAQLVENAHARLSAGDRKELARIVASCGQPAPAQSLEPAADAGSGG